MANFRVHARPRAIGIHSFTTGFISSPELTPRTESDILAKALWLERHGREDEAELLLDRYCVSKR